MTDKEIKEAAEKLKLIPAIKEKLKSIFLKMEADQVQDIKLSEVKLKDGTTLTIEGEAPVVGASVQVVSDGGNIPAVDGEYELEDGSKITIASGKISEVKPAEQKKEEAPVQMSSDDFNIAIKTLTDRIDALEKKSGDTELKLSAANKTIDKQKEDLKAQIVFQKEMFGLVEIMSGLPASAPIEPEKKLDITKEDRLERFHKNLQSLKK